MSLTSRRARLLVSVGAGLALGVVYSASPLTLYALVAFPLVLRWTTRALPETEARTVAVLLFTAFGVRLALIAALFIGGIPWHDDLSVGSLSGDEAYNIGRALRTRDVLLGVATTKYDYVVAFDEYGRSSYITFLTALQIIFGPTVVGVRVLNAVLFLASAALLFRLARASFGMVPAVAGMGLLLFLPSLIYASASALKESVYFLATSAFLVASIGVFRAPTRWRIAAAIVVAAASLWLLSDLRRGGAVLAVAGLAMGLGARVLMATARRAAAGGVILIAAGAAAAWQPAVEQRFRTELVSAAKIHTGHVFTVGQAYKLLDEGFYVNPQTPAASTLTLTPSQSARFVARSALSFLVTPLPWEIGSARGLALLPEQLVWYLILVGLPAGVIAGWRRDPLVTAVLLGYVLPTAAILALTNGNMGTLVRLRGLVTPYILWISMLGYCAVLEAAGRARWFGPSSASTGSGMKEKEPDGQRSTVHGPWSTVRGHASH